MARLIPKHLPAWVTATLILIVILIVGYIYDVLLVALVVGLALFVGILLTGGSSGRRRRT